MIPFNVPPYAGPEMECLEKAGRIHKEGQRVAGGEDAGVEGISDNILHERTGDGSASVRDRRG